MFKTDMGWTHTADDGATYNYDINRKKLYLKTIFKEKEVFLQYEESEIDFNELSQEFGFKIPGDMM